MTTFTTPTTPSKTAEMVLGWIAKDGGDPERTARWMRDSLRLGGIKACRAMIWEAVAEGAHHVVTCRDCGVVALAADTDWSGLCAPCYATYWA